MEGDDRFVVDDSRPPSVTGMGVLMNMNVAPFTDPRVRMACKLAIDRRSILDRAFLGRGEVGNDLFAPGFPDYPADIPQRPYDPDQARRLLAEAGAPGTPVTLTTAAESTGLVPMCTLLAQQLAAVGLPVTIDERPPGGLYADYDAYGRFPMAATYSTAAPPLQYYEVTRTAGNPFGLGWNRPDVDAMVTAARALTGPDRAAASARIHRILYAEDNTLLPVFRPVLSARTAGVQGVPAEQYPTFDRATMR